ncbi:MAG TPA: hypothetical protein PLL10_10430, partial [Elusimicrobiales bacterium]|nr:hypothetical protein [Elusimicrobiales bacterium]
AGQTVDTQIAITNKGLVAARNVELKWPESDPALKVTSPYSAIESLGAGQTMVVPVKIYLEHLSCHRGDVGCGYAYTCAAGETTNVKQDGAVKIIAGDAGSCGIANSSGSGGTQFRDGGAGWSSTGVGGSLVTQVAVAQAQTITTGGCAINACNGPCQIKGSDGNCYDRPNGTSCGGSVCSVCSLGSCVSKCNLLPCGPCQTLGTDGQCAPKPDNTSCGEACMKCKSGVCDSSACTVDLCGPCEEKGAGDAECKPRPDGAACGGTGDICTVGACKSGACDSANSVVKAYSSGLCPNRKPKPGYTPATNGCGPSWFQQIPDFPPILNCQLEMNVFNTACNEHDSHYGTCGFDKNYADQLFFGSRDASRLVVYSRRLCRARWSP